MFYVVLQHSDYETDITDIVPIKKWDKKHEEFLLDIAHDISYDYKIKAVIQGNVIFNDALIHNSIEDFYGYHKVNSNKIVEFALQRIKELDGNEDVLEEIDRYTE